MEIMTKKERELFNHINHLMNLVEAGRYAPEVELNRLINKHGADTIERLFDIEIERCVEHE